MKRIVVTVTVPDETDVDDVAYSLFPNQGADVTAWEWLDFFADVADGLVNAERDGTVDDSGDAPSYGGEQVYGGERGPEFHVIAAALRLPVACRCEPHVPSPYGDWCSACFCRPLVSS